MTIMGLNSIMQATLGHQCDYWQQMGIIDGENNLYVGASDKNSNVTNSSSHSKIFADSDVDTENFLVSVGDDVEIVNGDGKAQIVAAGSDNNITSKGESKVYFQGGNANISLGDGDDTVILSGEHINFNGGNGDNDVTSGSLNIKLYYGQFFMNGAPVVVDNDIIAAFRSNIPTLTEEEVEDAEETEETEEDKDKEEES